MMIVRRKKRRKGKKEKIVSFPFWFVNSITCLIHLFRKIENQKQNFPTPVSFFRFFFSKRKKQRMEAQKEDQSFCKLYSSKQITQQKKQKILKTKKKKSFCLC